MRNYKKNIVTCCNTDNYRIYAFYSFSENNLFPHYFSELKMAWMLNNVFSINLQKKNDLKIVFNFCNNLLEGYLPQLEFIKAKDHQLRLITFKLYENQLILDNQNEIHKKVENYRNDISHKLLEFNNKLKNISFILFIEGFHQSLEDENIEKKLRENQEMLIFKKLDIDEYSFFKQLIEIN